MARAIRRFLYLVLASAIAATLTIAWHNGDGSGELMAIGAWAASPYVGLAALVAWATKDRLSLGIVTVGCLILVAFGLFAFIDGFYFHLDAQNGLLFLFVPFWQWGGLIVMAAIGGLIRLARK